MKILMLWAMQWSTTILLLITANNVMAANTADKPANATIIVIDPKLGCVGKKGKTDCVQLRQQTMTAALESAKKWANEQNGPAKIFTIGITASPSADKKLYVNYRQEVKNCLLEYQCTAGIRGFASYVGKSKITDFQFRFFDIDTSFDEILDPSLYDKDLSTEGLKYDFSGVALNVARDTAPPLDGHKMEQQVDVFVHDQLALLLPDLYRATVGDHPNINSFDLIVISDTVPNTEEQNRDKYKGKRVQLARLKTVPQFNQGPRSKILNYDNYLASELPKFIQLDANADKDAKLEAARIEIINRSAARLYKWRYQRTGTAATAQQPIKEPVEEPVDTNTSPLPSQSDPVTNNDVTSAFSKTVIWGAVILVFVLVLFGAFILIQTKNKLNLAVKPLEIVLVPASSKKSAT